MFLLLLHSTAPNQSSYGDRFCLFRECGKSHAISFPATIPLVMLMIIGHGQNGSIGSLVRLCLIIHLTNGPLDYQPIGVTDEWGLI